VFLPHCPCPTFFQLMFNVHFSSLPTWYMPLQSNYFERDPIISGCWQVLSPTKKEISHSDQILSFASRSKTIQNVVRPTRSPRQQWPPCRTKSGDLSIVFFSRVGLKTYQHFCGYWIKVRVMTSFIKIPFSFSFTSYCL